jgi:hypothetical protein
MMWNALMRCLRTFFSQQAATLAFSLFLLMSLVVQRWGQGTWLVRAHVGLIQSDCL